MSFPAPSVQVFQVPPGSLIVLRNVYFGPDGDLEQLRQLIAERVGHEEFLMLNLDAGAKVEDVLTWEQVVERLGPK